MRGLRRSTTRQPHSARHLAALLLLVVLGGGLLITTFTRGWLAAAPYHDHLILGGHGQVLAHHAHDSDDLARALVSLEVVTSPATDGTDGIPAPEGRVISLRLAVAVGFEVSGFSPGATLAASLPPVPAAAGRRLAAADTCRVAGWLSAPPAPPPQPA